MKMNAYIAGVGMTRFGKHLDQTLKGLAGEAIREALTDAGIDSSAIEVAYMGNAAGGVVQGQEMISGQVALRELGIGKIPVINVENACATSSTAFNQACAMVTAGAYDVALVCGFEKLFHEDKMRSFAAFDGAVDTENPDGVMGALKALAARAGEEVDEDKRWQDTLRIHGYLFPDDPRAHEEYGTTREQIAGVNRQELLPRQPQPPGPVPGRHEHRRSPGRQGNRLPPDPAHVFPHRRRRRGSGRGERAQGEGTGTEQARAGAVFCPGFRLRRSRRGTSRWVPTRPIWPMMRPGSAPTISACDRIARRLRPL